MSDGRADLRFDVVADDRQALLLEALLPVLLAGDEHRNAVDESAAGVEDPQLLGFIDLCDASVQWFERRFLQSSIRHTKVIESLEAALWCFATTESFREAILTAANLGFDSDTVAAITGQIAGAFYGARAIPGGWLEKLYMSDVIDKMARQLFEVNRDSGFKPF